jgi:hypothetical protein
MNTDAKIEVEEDSVLSAYGTLQPVRYTTKDDTPTVFIYPRAAGDPKAADVAATLKRVDGMTFPAHLVALADRPVVTSFESVLGRADWDAFLPAPNEDTLGQP